MKPHAYSTIVPVLVGFVLNNLIRSYDDGHNLAYDVTQGTLLLLGVSLMVYQHRIRVKFYNEYLLLLSRRDVYDSRADLTRH